MFRKNALANAALFPLEAIPALIALPAELTARNVPLETVHILVRAVVDRQEALRIQSVELRKRSYALRFYLRSKSRDGVENADDDSFARTKRDCSSNCVAKPISVLKSKRTGFPSESLK